MNNDELADRAEAIVAHWDKYGRIRGWLFALGDENRNTSRSCLVGANAVVAQNFGDMYNESFLEEFGRWLDEQALATRVDGINTYKSLPVSFNDFHDDETVSQALRDFAAKHRSDAYRSVPGGGGD